MSDYYHIKAVLSGGRTKTIYNKDETEVLTHFVLPYTLNGTISAKWGTATQTYQALELRIYRTSQAWDKREGNTFEDFVRSQRNLFTLFKKKADAIAGSKKHRVFIIMPIQGKESGSADEQRIYREYDERFEVLEELLQKLSCVAIRIDKEYPLDQLVARIKEEISKSQFTIADLTDERPSCYFEAGYAEGLSIPIIYIASENSVINPKEKTKIHFDIHMHVNLFSNQRELKKKVERVIEKNRSRLFKS